MCDYSLHNVASRPAKVGDKLTTRNFGAGTRGFSAPEDPNTAVCVLPGTELAFTQAVTLATAEGPSGDTGAGSAWRSFAKSTKTSRWPITMPSN